MNKKKIVIKSVTFLVSGFIVSTAFLINYDTFSFYTEKLTGEVGVSAANEKDIIKSIDLETDKFGNTKSLVLQKGEEYKGVPVIYFSIDGDIKDYILNINPLVLNSFISKVGIKEKTIITLDQFINLLASDKDKITGTINIRALNDFVYNKNYKLELSKDYLIDRFKSQMPTEDKEVIEIAEKILESDQKSLSEKRLVDFNLYTFKENDMNMYEIIHELLRSVGHQIFSKNDSKVNSLVSKKEHSLSLQKEQIELIDIIEPKLTGYMKDLEVTVKNLNKVIDDNILKIEKLNGEKEILEIKVKELEEINEIKNQEIEKLNKKIDEVNNDIKVLKDNNKELDKRISHLKEDRNDLKKSIKNLRKEKEALLKENERLIKENEELKNEIEELKNKLSSDDGNDTVSGEVYGSN